MYMFNTSIHIVTILLKSLTNDDSVFIKKTLYYFDFQEKQIIWNE